MVLEPLVQQIKRWGKDLGFQAIGITDLDLGLSEPRLTDWLHKQYHGEMDYMARYGLNRARGEFLLPNALSAIMVRMDYLPESLQLNTPYDNPHQANIARYAHHKDYHKIIRKKLQTLAKKIEAQIGPFGYRAFADSAPILEKPLAIKAGLGFMGKHTNVIHPQGGSWFFLGTLLLDIDLPKDLPFEKNHCGTCTACINVCPTQAIVAPFQLDARRCISYLTIELQGTIPVEFRKAIGNRIYGCDDCQLFCPWNKFAKPTQELGFQSLRGLDHISLLELFAWTESEFLAKTEGSPIRRIGFESWLRNIAIALGNAPTSPMVIQALKEKLDPKKPDSVSPYSSWVREHIEWALLQHTPDYLSAGIV